MMVLLTQTLGLGVWVLTWYIHCVLVRTCCECDDLTVRSITSIVDCPGLEAVGSLGPQAFKLLVEFLPRLIEP